MENSEIEKELKDVRETQKRLEKELNALKAAIAGNDLMVNKEYFQKKIHDIGADLNRIKGMHGASGEAFRKFFKTK